MEIKVDSRPPNANHTIRVSANIGGTTETVIIPLPGKISFELPLETIEQLKPQK